MKKSKFLSLILSVILLLQCLMIPASAVGKEIPQETTDSGQASPFPQQNAEMPFGSVCIMNGCRTIDGMAPLGGSDRRLDTALAAFAYEVTTGTVVYAYNPDIKVSPGTLTKIVTALVAIENSELDEVVTVRDGIQSRVPMSSQTMDPNLKSGEKLTVEDLLHALLLTSANDAAVALAEHVAGSTQTFLEMMNNRVRQIGCFGTEFGNISGLETAVSFTTARDMAKIVVEATRNETFATIFGTTTYTVPATNMVEERKLITTNYLSDVSIIPQFYDRRVTGGLASYSAGSGASVVSTSSHNNMTYVCVVMGATREYAENGWSVLSYGNFNEMAELMKYVYNNFKANRIIYEGMSLMRFPVADGECQVVGQPFVDIDSIVPADASMDNLIMKSTVVGGGLSAPIAKDQLIATVEVWYRNSCLTEIELFAMGDVKRYDSTGVSIHDAAVKKDTDGAGILSIIGTVCVILLGIAILYLTYNSYMRSRIRARRRRRRAERRRSR